MPDQTRQGHTRADHTRQGNTRPDQTKQGYTRQDQPRQGYTRPPEQARPNQARPDQARTDQARPTHPAVQISKWGWRLPPPKGASIESAVSLWDTWRAFSSSRFLRFLEALASPSLRRPSASPPLGSLPVLRRAPARSGALRRAPADGSGASWRPSGHPWATPGRAQLPQIDPEVAARAAPAPPAGAPSRPWPSLAVSESCPGAALGPKWRCKVPQSRSHS